MLPKTRAVLDMIDDVLAVGGSTSQELWDVLTALRGPDEDLGVKYTTTVPIRRAAFPKTAEKVRQAEIYLPASFSSDSQNVVRPRDSVSNHFFYHVYDAARILGILSDG